MSKASEFAKLKPDEFRIGLNYAITFAEVDGDGDLRISESRIPLNKME